MLFFNRGKATEGRIGKVKVETKQFNSKKKSRRQNANE